ncbi:glycosyltransferase family 2 protein [Vibrio parahaemolyticus]|uniref:glycosyltransferase family 2 protein n=1 Tax=Vibrio parahaemolyticus TaxID=670 RepID=UPI00186A8705|nr:glycosyltransferase family 2 protein [Vibrio parahaemolyticus]EIY8172749.1 glycosyltransferase family 2 protein [Vibrio parahaemolyticus]EIY8250539.1 glycosyltransferase family 2 protein [Vibrio parahaemolyticus]MBE4002193.1 glycosyltransferase family 2 protein [Vibrio parahaemolyticus]MBM4894440.1 glycosyltransferase family 2 protein [Vibrio parahaemolyticus]MBM4943778.1 glycosyltransferase family 2 protein [Vibrio parahaemolyticus]
MTTYVSIISHGHCGVIESITNLEAILSSFKVVIKSNKPGDDFKKYCAYNNFHWLDGDYFLGFGENNNYVFEYCNKSLGMSDDDYFIILNPDVFVTPDSLCCLIDEMSSCSSKLSTINLFRDFDKNITDNSIRKFPRLSDFFSSYIGFGNSTIINKKMIDSIIEVDWAAGSFLAFKASHYRELNGFNEQYFMYCEDIDICYRSALLGERVSYHPQITAIHDARNANRKISKHLFWHVKSVFKFLASRKGLLKFKSRLQ